MNGVTSVNVSTSQTVFRAKTGDKKIIHEIIGKTNNLAMNKDRPVAEKREIAIRRILSSLKIKDLFVGKKIKSKEATIEHIKGGKKTTEEIVDYLGFEMPKKVMLERLKKENPEAYRVQMMNEAEHKMMLMSNWDILKTVLKGILKKQPNGEYEKEIEKAVNNGMMDADQAGALLTKLQK
jgi:hypothetical protein